MSEVLLNPTVTVPLASATVAANVNPSGNESGFGQIFNQVTQALQTQGDSTTPATEQLVQNIQRLTSSLNLPNELIEVIQAFLPKSISADGGNISLDASKTGVQGETELIEAEDAEFQTASENQTGSMELSLEAVCQMMGNIVPVTSLPLVQPLLASVPVNLEGVGQSGVQERNPGSITQMSTSLAEQLITQDSSIAQTILSPGESVETQNSPTFQSQSTLTSFGETGQIFGQTVVEPESGRAVAKQLDLPVTEISKQVDLQAVSVTKADPIAVTMIEGEAAGPVIPPEHQKFSLNSLTSPIMRGVTKENGRTSLGRTNQSLVNDKLIIQPQIQALADETRIKGVTGLSDLSSESVTIGESQLSQIDLSILQTGSSIANGNSNEMDSASQMTSVPFGDVLERLEETVMEGTEATSVKKEAVFSQMVEKAKFMVTNGASEMELQLKPDSLGKIQLRITMENNLISAKFVAESEQVKALIESNFTDLKQLLNQSGVQVDQLQVSVGQQGGGGENLTGNPFQGNSQTNFGAKRRFNETAEAETEYSGSVEPIRDNMRIDLIA